MKHCFALPAAAVLLAGAVLAEPGPAVRSVVRADARTGRLVRSVVVQPKVVAPRVIAPRTAEDRNPARKADSPPDGAAVHEIIEHAARKHNVDPNLVHAVVKVESNYNQFAVSHAGAEGFMQLIPSTARRFGVSNSFDARQNIDAGVRYLKYLQSLYGSNMRLVLAAYNAGEGAVGRYRGIPRYRETENYVYQVGRRWGELSRARRQVPDRKADPPVHSASAGAAPEHRPVETIVDAEGKIHLRTK